MTEPEQKLQTLRNTKSQKEKELASTLGKVEQLREERSTVMAKLSKFGIDDPKKIPGKIREFEARADELLETIQNQVPDAFRGGSDED